MYDIIPDIHGQAEKLKAALTNLGYRDRTVPGGIAIQIATASFSETISTVGLKTALS